MEASRSKEAPLEELSKEDLILKCKKFLLLAQKAKKAKDESVEELKRAKDNEKQLLNECNTLKEVLDTTSEKQKNLAEIENNLKVAQDKNTNLLEKLQHADRIVNEKNQEVTVLQETLGKLNSKISDFEIRSTEDGVKISNFQVKIDKLLNERKVLEAENKSMKDKYALVDKKLVEFQDKYIAEKKQHSTLQNVLEKKLEEKIERSSAESRDSLSIVAENKEVEGLCEKINESTKKIENLESTNSQLKEKCSMLERLVGEPKQRKLQCGLKEQDTAQNKNIDTEKVQEYELTLSVMLSEMKCLEDRCKVLENEKKTQLNKTEEVGCLKQEVLELRNEREELNRKLEDSMRESEAFVLERNALTDQLTAVQVKLDEMEKERLALKEETVRVNHDFEKTIQQLKEELKIQTEKCNGLENEKKVLMESVCKQSVMEEKFNAEKESLIKELHDMQLEKFNLETRLSDFEKEAIRKEEAFKLEQQEVLNRLNKQLAVFDSEKQVLVEAHENVLKDYEAKNNELKKELTSVNERCELLELEKQKLMASLKELSEATTNKEHDAFEMQELKHRLQDIEKEAQNNQEMYKKKLLDAEEKITIAEEKVAALEAENKNLESSTVESNVSNKNIVTELQSEMESLHKKFESTEEMYEAKILEAEGNVKMLEEKFSELKSEKEKIEGTAAELRSEIESLQEKFKCMEELYKSKLLESEEKFTQLKAEKEKLEDTAAERMSNENRVAELQSEIQSLTEKCESMRAENQLADSKFSEMEKQLVNSRLVSESLEAMAKQQCDEYDDLRAKVLAYDGLVAQLERVKNDIINVKIAYETLKSSAIEEVTAVKEFHSLICENFSQVVGKYVGKLAEGNAELLSDMNMMNATIKERGSTISKLEEEAASSKGLAAENEAKIKKLAEKLEEVQSDNNILRADVDEKVKSMREMEEEIWRLRSPDNPGDTLSTSTMSKVEESARVVDLEDSFEEKYNKLRVMALKLKKMVKELQNQVEQEKTKLLNERQEFQSKLSQFQAQTKAFQALQAENDKLQDQCDSDKKQLLEFRKSLEKARDESITFAKSTEEIKFEREKFKQEKASFDIIKKELTAQIQNLKKTVEKEQNKVKDFDKERERYEAEIQKREKRLEEEAERHKATLAKVQNQKLEQKKHSLLSLEMADYERTATELNKRLETKENQIRELESSLETQRELSKSLQESVINLESQIAAEQKFTDASKLQTNSLQDTVVELKKDLTGKAAIIAELERNSEEKKLESEKLTIEVAELTAEKVKVEEKCRLQQENFSREIRILEEKASQQNDLIKHKDLELAELKKDFDSYKIRAQSVLRQSQNNLPSSRHQDTEEELKLMRTTSDNFRSKLEESLRRSQVLQDENQALMEEKARLFQKVQELMGNLAELRGVNAELRTTEQKVREQGDENTRMLKVQLETMAQVYKKELEEKETEYKKQVEEARTALDQAERQLHLHLDTGFKDPPGHRRNLSNSKMETPTADLPGHRRQHSANFVPVKSERETLDVLMLEREACEGSESVDSTSPRLVPLDQLLAPPSNTIDVSALTEKLDKSENRIQHLTTLLSDAESDAARLQQLNEVLKEEIRRKERNEAREQHANNLEYLKNIVIKFATLPRGDERLRLVPVLNTILKLSPEEENKLIRVARDGAEQAGWGTYLGGMWSAGQ